MNRYPTIDAVATGGRIEMFRHLKGYSIKELQDYFGFEHPQAIYHWRSGRSLPSIDNLYALAKLFDVLIDDIVVGEEDIKITANRMMLDLIPHNEQNRVYLFSMSEHGNIRYC